jgi:hypothetical protein
MLLVGGWQEFRASKIPNPKNQNSNVPVLDLTPKPGRLSGCNYGYVYMYVHVLIPHIPSKVPPLDTIVFLTTQINKKFRTPSSLFSLGENIQQRGDMNTKGLQLCVPFFKKCTYNLST